LTRIEGIASPIEAAGPPLRAAVYKALLNRRAPRWADAPFVAHT
jgi:hypothetical protein